VSEPLLHLSEHTLIRFNSHPVNMFASLSCEKAEAALRELKSQDQKLTQLTEKISETLFNLISLLQPNFRTQALNLKRKVANRKPFDRAELENLETGLGQEDLALLRDYSTLLEAYALGVENCKKLFNDEFLKLRKKLHETAAKPLVQAGTLFSSESLYSGVQRYLKSSIVEKREKKVRQLERSFTEHLSRACGKTTPRGLLTGVALRKWTDQNLNLKSSEIKRRTLLNLGLARAIAFNLSGRDGLWQNVVPRPNPTALIRNGVVQFQKVNWLETFRRPSGEIIAAPSALRVNDLIAAFLEITSSRKLSAREVLDTVSEKFTNDISMPELTQLYRRLCETGLIIGNLEIPFEERDGLTYLIKWLANHPGDETSKNVLGELRRLTDLLQKTDATPLENNNVIILTFEAKTIISNVLGLLGLNSDSIEIQDALMPEIYANTGASHSPGVPQKSLQNAIRVCLNLAGHTSTMNHATVRSLNLLRRFDLPEGDVTVDLLDLVHADSNDGKLQPIINKEGKKNHDLILNFRSAFENFAAQNRHNGDSLDFDKFSLSHISPSLRDAVQFGVYELKFQMANVENQPALIWKGAAYSLGAAFVRYEQVLKDGRLNADARAIINWARERKETDRVWANPLILTQSSLDTALVYDPPCDLDLEVGFSRSLKPKDKIISMDQVRIRANHDKDAPSLTLYWQSAEGLKPLYVPYISLVPASYDGRLCELLSRHGTGLGPSLFQWRDLSWHFKSETPRLKSGEVVFARRTWIFTADELARFARDDVWENFVSWQNLRFEKNIPQHIFVAIGDSSPFWINLSNPISLEILGASVLEKKDATRVEVQEMLPAPDQQFGSIDGEPIASEFLGLLGVTNC
jgi:hypothetical protein